MLTVQMFALILFYFIFFGGGRGGGGGGGGGCIVSLVILGGEYDHKRKISINNTRLSCWLMVEVEKWSLLRGLQCTEFHQGHFIWLLQRGWFASQMCC